MASAESAWDKRKARLEQGKGQCDAGGGVGRGQVWVDLIPGEESAHGAWHMERAGLEL